MPEASEFDYLIRKIENAEFRSTPFRHIYIEDFFRPDHFEQIVGSREISAPEARSDEALISALYDRGFKIIPFPGCVTDAAAYLHWHQDRHRSTLHSACEGFGMALRLYDLTTPLLASLNRFITGPEFNQAIVRKLDLDADDCIIDGGIQKYLDGYEISPHPDIRQKAATFMVNINPNEISESLDHHTHYMKLKDTRRYVQHFWEGNPEIERAWVPWDWAETVSMQTRNNSIVLFSPSNDTLHAVRARYDHLRTQRTQLYGNIFYKESRVTRSIEWEQLDLIHRPQASMKAGAPEGWFKRVTQAFRSSRRPGAAKRTARAHQYDIGVRNF